MRILDTTLRDGSYAINFQFTADDTGRIAGALENSGFELIEVGHGVGLHASEAGYGRAAETDEAYLKAAGNVLSKATFGMFCIPGIARLEDIDMAADYGMGFIRIGTDADKVGESEPFISRAKHHGMYISSNIMKSYVMPPAEFADKARLAASFGTDVLCIVDSAGGMLASDIDDYFRATMDATDVPLAFHGHDNLGLAIAHSLRAIELGAVIVDSSLQGMGRSAGNASTEMLVAILRRMGLCDNIDPLAVMDIGEALVQPLLPLHHPTSLDTVAGYAQFHTSHMSVIRKYSKVHDIDPRKLIVELCKHDRVNAPEDLVDKLAKEIRTEQREGPVTDYALGEYFGNEQDD